MAENEDEVTLDADALEQARVTCETAADFPGRYTEYTQAWPRYLTARDPQFEELMVRCLTRCLAAC
jgi:hypothetical protein